MDQNNGMNKKIQIVLIGVSLLSMIGCGFDVPDRTKITQISETIEESKAKGVFLAEYKPNREIIKKAWAEILGYMIPLEISKDKEETSYT